MHIATVPLPVESANKDLLRFITCGSVDDGKSTLIGRLLHDQQDDIRRSDVRACQGLEAFTAPQVTDIDFALLVDGLEAEREQGITIDVAYRFFTTPKRSFMVADTPGHEQYTRNMATGASNAQLAIILVDARKGLLVQTKRHSFICSLLGIRHVVLAVNKIDLMGFEQETFDRIVCRLPVFCLRARLPLNRSDSDFGALWRQHHGAIRQHAMVHRSRTAGLPGDGRYPG